jgi:hypothetical protein
LNVLVSMMSAPASRYCRWIVSMSAGRVSDSRSFAPARSRGQSAKRALAVFGAQPQELEEHVGRDVEAHVVVADVHVAVVVDPLGADHVARSGKRGGERHARSLGPSPRGALG